MKKHLSSWSIVFVLFFASFLYIGATVMVEETLCKNCGTEDACNFGDAEFPNGYPFCSINYTSTPICSVAGTQGACG